MEKNQQLLHGVVFASLHGMLVKEHAVFDPPLDVFGGDAAFMVQDRVVHLDRDEMSRYGGSTILIQNSKKGGGKFSDNQVNRSFKVSNPPKKRSSKYVQPHKVAKYSLFYTTPAE